ncbi:MAG: S49 family peptidase, partial [bacterium]
MATVAWVRDLGASGGYWVASACKRIVADRCSTIGSIGVLSPHLEFSELMKKYGVKYEGFKAGAYKDMGIPFRKTTEKERKLIREQLNRLHEMFIREVADNRGMDVKDMKKLSQGQVYLGEEAKEAGLVDKLGGRAEAIRQCEIMGNFRHLMIVDIEDFREEMLFFLRSLLAGGPFMPRWDVRDMMAELFSHPGNFAL